MSTNLFRIVPFVTLVPLIFNPTADSVEPQCFKCVDCNVVKYYDQTVDCPSPGSCYSAFASEDDDYEVAIIRDCIISESAETPCETAIRKYTDKYPKGVFENCASCSSSEAGACNGDPFRINGPSPVICYKCSHCDHVDNNTPNIVCRENRCCYRAGLKDDKNGEYYSVRGCKRLKHGQSCDLTCQYVQQKHKQEHPEGDMSECKSCEEDASNNCNYISLPSATKSIMCYKCKGLDCATVTSLTPNVLCAGAACCYSVGIMDGSITVVRDCAVPRIGRTCEHTCEDIKKQHGNNDVEKCKRCKIDDSSECNRHTYEVSDISDSHNNHTIACFSCRNCNHVGIRTRLILCEPKCCYMAILKMSADKDWFAVRDCMQVHNGESCDSTCQSVGSKHAAANPDGKMHICIPCKDNAYDNCNRRTFVASKSENTHSNTNSGILKCYDCRDCHIVSGTTPTEDCGDGRCCYSTYKKNGPTGKYYVERGCGNIYQNRPCPETCRDQKSRHLWKYPNGEFVNCLPCSDKDKCNKLSYYDNPEIVPHYDNKEIDCYNCDSDTSLHCYIVSESTPKRSCRSPNCCYVAKIQKSDDVKKEHVIRDCLLGSPCTNTCFELKQKYPGDDIPECDVCVDNAGDRCNSKSIEVPWAGTTIWPGEGYILCYDCSTNCNNVSASTPPKVKCLLPGICYTSLVRAASNTEIFAVRGCGGITDCESIKKKYIDDHPGSSVHYCVTCGDLDLEFGCNLHTYVPNYPTQL